MIEAIDSLREMLPTMDRAWYAAQVDPWREDAAKEHLYLAADALAADMGDILRTLANEAAPDHEDRDTLRHVNTPAAKFYLACYDAIATFRFWQDHDDFAAQLDAVELAAVKWLPAGKLDAALRKAKAEAATAKMALRGQQSGLARATAKKKRTTLQRAEAARDVCGSDDLLAGARTLEGAALAALAAVYGRDDPEAFQRDARHNASNLRKLLERDAARLS
ncbi:hypothetical protein [Falsiruegeria mediterranea]|uniref:hypothetical protein n=1 Tax=Falsiruegeria mediterranea TaxID=1280832 RepID=UPI0015F27530|nr:hypothetical protein [Falsiruegeria mediterranea]